MSWMPILRMQRGLGLAFAAAASLAELGPIAQLMASGQGLIFILAAGLAYQAGGALARWTPLSRWTWLIAASGGGAVLVTFPPGHLIGLPALMALAWGLQAARRRHAQAHPGEAPSTAHKRTARVVGFILAPLLPLLISVAALIAVIAAAIPLCRPMAASIAPRYLGRPIEWVMILHQMHYFTYCYALLLILYTVAGGAGLVGVWFGLGWITYLSAERLWSNVALPCALVGGHVVVALTLGGIAAFGNVGWMVVLCWILTGLGGGTVYCLTRLHKFEGLPPESLDIAEDLGHVGGVAVALLCAAVLGFSASALAAVAAGFALITIAVFVTLHPVARSPQQES